ncbi:MAG TPA: hypothetical protein VL945_00715 [Candidatus Saccharimonadales bacterium]|nr:hypothetical protein [Candidatus Saccharimonadales bacterium]
MAASMQITGARAPAMAGQAEARSVLRRREGLALELGRADLDPNDTLVVGTGGFALGSPVVRGARFLVTYGLIQCVALIAASADRRIWMESHMRDYESAESTIRRLEQFMKGSKEVFLYGGSLSDCDILSTIIKYLSSSPEIRITGMDTLHEQYCSGNAGRAIAVDTTEGRIFVPSQRIEAEHSKQRRTGPLSFLNDYHHLRYDGKDFEAFLELSRN